jgi:hypothetical protein
LPICKFCEANAPHRRSAVIALRGGLEREIAQMDEASAELFLTEYGIAELKGKTLIQRAKALIAIAHPDFREGLEKAWRGIK